MELNKGFAIVINCLRKIKNFFSVTSVSDLFLYFFVALYPCCPSFFGIGGYKVSSFLTLVCLFCLLISKNFRTKRFSPVAIVFFLMISLFCFLPFAVNGQLFGPEILSLFLNRFLVPIFIIFCVNDKTKMETCISILLIQGTILCFLSLTEQFGFNVFSILHTSNGFGVFDTTSARRFGIMRAESCFGQAIAFAIYLTMIIGLVFYRLIQCKNRPIKSQWKLIFLLFFSNLCLFLTVSRAPILIAFIMELLLLFRVNQKLRNYALSFLFICLACFLLLYVFFPSSSIALFFSNVIEIFSELFSGSVSKDNPFAYRVGLLESARVLVGNRFWFGTGINTNRTFIDYTPFGYIYLQASFDNYYLSLFCAYGIVGCFGWFLYYLSFFTRFFAHSSRHGMTDSLLCFLLVVLFVLVNNISVDSLDESRMFVVILGLLLALPGKIESSFSPSESLKSLSMKI